MKHVTDQNVIGLGLTILLVFIGMAFGWAASNALWEERLQDSGLTLLRIAQPTDVDKFVIAPVEGCHNELP